MFANCVRGDYVTDPQNEWMISTTTMIWKRSTNTWCAVLLFALGDLQKPIRVGLSKIKKTKRIHRASGYRVRRGVRQVAARKGV